MTDFTALAASNIPSFLHLPIADRTRIVNALSGAHKAGYNAGYRNALHSVAVHDSEYVGGE